MKNVILNVAVSLDGFIEGPNAQIDWCIMEDDMNFDGFVQSVDTIFYGRVSYESWGNYQPDKEADQDEKLMWASIHAKNKYVFSHQNRTDRGARYITKDILREVEAIKRQEGKDIWLYGGAQLIKTFIDLGLVDIYKISLHPVVLGSGKPLFEDLKDRIGLTLIGTKVFKSGVVELTYSPL